MNRASLLFLLVGFGAGVLVGVGLDESETARVRPSASPSLRPAPEVRAARPAESDRAGQEEGADPAVTLDSPRSDRAAATPLPGAGTLEIESPAPGDYSFRLHGTTILGEPRLLEIEGPDEREAVASLSLRSGDYVLRWQVEHDAGERQLPVRVMADGVTRVSASEILSAPYAAERAGMGLLVVEVLDLAGKRLPGVSGSVRGRGMLDEEEVDFECGPEGEARLFLVPGDYVLKFGSQARPVRVVAGETAHVVFSYRSEGELRIKGRCGMAHLERAGADASFPEYYAMGDSIGPMRLLYVPAGEYVVVSSGVPLGRAVVRSGRVTEVEFEVPTGSVDVVARIHPELAKNRTLIVSYRLRGLEPGLLSGQGRAWTSYFSAPEDARLQVPCGNLRPGRYCLTTSGPMTETRQWEFSVGPEPGSVEIELRPKQ